MSTPIQLSRIAEMRSWPWLTAALLAVVCTQVARAAEAEPPADYGKAATGDWGGPRARLAGQGVALSTGYVSEAARNQRGGSDQKTRYSDQWSFGTQLDLDKLLGARHGSFELMITHRSGHNLGDDAALGTLQGVQEVYGRGQTWRLTRLSYRQTWFDGGLDLKLGRLPVGDDFAAFPCNFQNLTFCGSQPGNVRGELWYSYPVSQWAARAVATLAADVSVQLGVYQANPRYIDDDYAHHGGLYPNNPSGTTGALIPLEFAWKPTWRELPGSYKIGAWYDTSSADDVLLDTHRRPIATSGGSPLQRNSRRGVYLNFQQQIFGSEKGRGASAFLNVTQSDKATAASMDRQIAAGLTWRGLLQARPGDTVGLAVGSNHVNRRVAEGLAIRNARDGGGRPLPGSEYVVELFYAWTPLPFISLQPNLQVVRHPGGIDTNEAVVVIGLRTSVDF